MTYKYVEPAIFELVKNLVDDDKAFWMRAPQNVTGDFIVYQRVDRQDFGKNILNRTAGTPGKAQAYIQIDAYATDPDTAKALGASIEYTLDGYNGTVYHGTDSPQASVVIGGITLQNDVDLVDQTDEPLLFRNSAVYLVTYNQ